MPADDDHVRPGCRGGAVSPSVEGRGTLRDDVNGLIRLGLARERGALGCSHFSTPTVDSGPPRVQIDDIEAAISHSEGEDHH